MYQRGSNHSSNSNHLPSGSWKESSMLYCTSAKQSTLVHDKHIMTCSNVRKYNEWGRLYNVHIRSKSNRNSIAVTILSECMLSYLIELWDHDKSCHLKNVYCDLPYQKAQQIAQEQVHQLAIPEVPWSTMNYVNCGVCNRLYDSGNLAL